MNGAPLRARPHLRHAHPARRLLVALAQPVPVELHHHATEAVGPDLLARRPNDERRLRSAHAGLLRRPPRPERRVGVEEQIDRLERLIGARHGPALVLVDAEAVGGTDDQILVAEVLRVPEGEDLLAAAPARPQRDQIANPEAHGVAFHLDERALHTLRLHAHRGLAACLRRIEKPTRVVVVLELRARRRLARRFLAELRLPGPQLCRVVAAQDRVPAGIERFAHLHAPEMLLGPRDLPFLGRVEHRFIPLGRLVPGDRVGEHHDVLGFLVLEEVVDAFVLEQPLHEVEVAFLVLHAVLALAVDMILDRARLDVE